MVQFERLVSARVNLTSTLQRSQALSRDPAAPAAAKQVHALAGRQVSGMAPGRVRVRRAGRIGGVASPRPPGGLPHGAPGAELHEVDRRCASRAAPGPPRGRALPGRGDATQVPRWSRSRWSGSIRKAPRGAAPDGIRPHRPSPRLAGTVAPSTLPHSIPAFTPKRSRGALGTYSRRLIVTWMRLAPHRLSRHRPEASQATSKAHQAVPHPTARVADTECPALREPEQ